MKTNLNTILKIIPIFFITFSCCTGAREDVNITDNFLELKEFIPYKGNQMYTFISETSVIDTAELMFFQQVSQTPVENDRGYCKKTYNLNDVTTLNFDRLQLITLSVYSNKSILYMDNSIDLLMLSYGDVDTVKNDITTQYRMSSLEVSGKVYQDIYVVEKNIEKIRKYYYTKSDGFIRLVLSSGKVYDLKN